MIKVIIDFLQFIFSCVPLLTSVAIFTLLSLLLAKSIKRHSKIYYIILAIPFFLVAIPTILRWCGVEIAGFVGVPVLGQILRDYIHMGTLGHPLLIIIMYMGALNVRTPFVKKLMSIRKELSIIVGFPVLTHSLIRVANNFPSALKYFTDNDSYMENASVVSETGAAIGNFALVLGILMLALFLPLWITSFGWVHKRMKPVKWKKLQKWSYVLYATLFIHAIGISANGVLNPRERTAPRPAIEISAQTTSGNLQAERSSAEGRDREGDRREATQAGENRAQSEQTVRPENREQSAPVVARESRRQPKGFADIEVSRQTRQYIHIISLVSIYASYLYLRVRKARKANRKRLEIRQSL